MASSQRRAAAELNAEILVAWQKYIARKDDEITLKEGDVVELLDTADPASAKKQKLDPEFDAVSGELLDNSAARHKLSVKPRRTHLSSRHSPTRLNLEARWLVREVSGSKKQGWVPCKVLQALDDPTPGGGGLPGDALFKRQAVVKELVETEQEFVKDIDHVVHNYLLLSESKKVPKVIRDNFEMIFGNLREIAEFHRTVLMEGVKFYANEPHLLGKFFLRLERDFDRHVDYYMYEPQAQTFLDSCDEAHDYFDELSQRLSDDKTITEHLKLPIQRINDYQLLLKELVRYSACLGEDNSDLQKALELMLSVPHRSQDEKFTSNIEGYRGSIHKLGRLLAHDWFSVTFGEVTKERYLFLFKGKILICKVRRISDDRSVFQLKDIIQLNRVAVKEHPDEEKIFELLELVSGQSLVLTAHREHITEYWIKEIKQFAKECEEGEDTEDDFQLAPSSPPTELSLSKLEEFYHKTLEVKVEAHQEVTVQEIHIESKEASLESFVGEQSKERYSSKQDEEHSTKVESKKALTTKHIEEKRSREVSPDPIKEHIETNLAELIQEQEVNVESSNEMSHRYTSSSARAEGYSESSYSRRSHSALSNDGTSSRYGSESAASRYSSVESSLGGSKYESLSSKYGSGHEIGDSHSYSRRSIKGDEDYGHSRRLNLGDDDDYNVSKRSIKTVTSEYGDGDNYSRRTVRASADLVGDSDSYAVRKSIRTSVEGLGGYGETEGDTYSYSRRAIGEGKDSRTYGRRSIGDTDTTERYTRKTLAVEDDIDEDLVAKYSPSKYLGEEKESENVYAKFERKYSRSDSTDSKSKYKRTSSIEPKDDEDVYAKYSRKYSSKLEDEDEGKTRKYSRSDSNEKKSYKRTDSAKSDRESSSIRSVSETTVENGKGIKKEAVQSSESLTTSSTYMKETTKSGSTHMEETHITGDDERNRFIKTIRGAEIELTTDERTKRGETDKPEFVVKLKDTELAENTYLRFMVKVRGDPNPEVVFFKDGHIVEKSDRYDVIRDHSDRGFYELLIPEVKLSDAGSYKCVASNKWGEDSTEATLRITTENIHKDMPEGELLKPGESSEFNWKKDGQPFEPDERFKVLMGEDEDSLALVFQHVKADDVGFYTCVAQTSRGHISCSAELTVHGTVNQLVREPEKPKLIIEKKEPIVSAGGSAMIELQVKGYPKPQVKWTHEGKPIEPSSKYKFLYEDEETMSLVIKDVQKEDAGKYQCTAENDMGSDTAEVNLTVKIPPKVKTKLEDVDAHADLLLKIPVEIEGFPKPTVVFYKDGKAIKKDERVRVVEEDDKIVLVIEKTVLKDSGAYSIVATNELAQISEFFNVNIHTKPKILEKLEKHKVVSQGETFELRVRVEAEPEAEVKWFKDEKEIKSDEHFHMKKDGDTYILKITGAVTTDAAQYKFKAMNIHGSVEDEVRVDVKKAPKVTKGLQDMTVTEHDTNVTFDVKLEAYPKPTVKWYLDEMEITETKTEFTRVESDDGVKLVIKEVNSELSGKYTCKLSNECGTAETSAKLTVNCAPRIIKKLKDTTVEEGATLHLEVEVEGCPSPTVKWLRNGREVNADARIKISRDSHRQENYNLAVDLIKYEEQGEYEVVVTNALGTVSSKSYVTVHTKPTITDSTMKDASRPESLEMSYIVRGTANPPPKATWTINDVELKPDGRVKISQIGEEYKLEILKLEMSDAGTVVCTLSNPLGAVKQQAKLEVTPEKELRRPKLKQGLQNQTIVKKNSVTFKAVVVGDPVPTATWSIDGREITDQEFEKYKMIIDTEDQEIQDGLKECTYSLTIPRCERCNGGKYTLNAKNKWGECDSSAQLTIVLRPEIEGPQNVSVIPGESTELVCKIQANPVAEVKWMKDDQIIKETDTKKIIADVTNETYKLVLTNAALSDDGYYRVVAKNDLGESSAEARVKAVTEKPTIITGLSDDHVEHTKEMCVMVRADGLPKPQIRWFLNGNPIKEDEHHKVESHTEAQVTSTLTVSNFNEADSGMYKAVAANVAGDAETAAQVLMSKIPPSFGKKLERSEEVNEGEPLELKAKINGSPKPTVAWYKNNEPIDDERVKTSVLPDGTVKLNIEKAQPSDSGAYKLVIKNPNGESSCLCAVAVTQKPSRPKFLKCFKDMKIPLGEPLRLEAQVQSYPPPEIKWFKDGAPVRISSNIHFETHPDGKIALIVDCAKPENAGQYEVVVTNKLGDASNDAHVNVSEKPKKPEFLTRLTPLTVVEGFPVKFEVKAIGFPTPKIAWTRNGAEVVSDSKHVKITELPDGTSVLVLDSANQARDALTYRAIAINDAGEAETSAPLTVLPASNDENPEEKPMFLYPLKDAIADEGQSLILSAPFTANPIPTVKWFKDGEPLIPSDRVLVMCDGIKVGLEILNAVPSDAGQYSVTLTNPLGQESSEAKGTVHKVFMPPHFTQTFTDLQQLPGRDAKFPCRVSGVPQPEVVWSKDGIPIKESDKYHIKRDGDLCCLYVLNSQPEDAGVYRATATNKEGEAVCTGSLEIVDQIKAQKKIEPPAFLKRIGDTELFKGMSAKFTACATGYPEPEVEWYHNDQKLFPSNRIKIETDRGLLRLTISDVDEPDLGKYSCKISNEYGGDICHANLNLDEGLESKAKRPISDQYIEFDKYKRTGAPMPLTDPPIISQMTDRHCTLSWKPSIPAGPRTPVTYQLEMCEMPHGDWFTVRTGIRSCTCGVRNLEPFRDYKFRVRVENKYGISDPSPHATTHRSKLEPELPKFRPYLPPEIDFRPETSPYFPKDFDIERPPHDNMAQAPRFLRQEHDTQYGVKDQNTNLFWFVYGYPKPTMSYYFNDEPIESGGRFDMSYTRNGQATLFINKMLDRDVGWYEAVARNEHGEARQRVRLEIAEMPVFIRRPEIQYAMHRGKVRFDARIVGVPYPEIKWYKDWKPLTTTSRMKIQFIEPDTTILVINDIITKDEGLYSVSARNVAGSVSSSAMLYVEDNDLDFNLHTYRNIAAIRPKKKPHTDNYDIGDELGRGTQGVTYHAVERRTGYNYAAKIMHGKGELRPFMYNELEILNELRHKKLISLHDSYETGDSLALILELASGGELVKDYLLKQDYYTERDIAGFIRQLLQGLQYMHERGYGHMGLNIGDLLIAHPGGDDLKITDFGLSRRILPGNLAPLKYGVPEYASPEAVNGEGTGLGQDMWSVGIITYILLSGRSPFRGNDDRETLKNVQAGKWLFEEDWWLNMSVEAKDFISKLLVYDSDVRMDVHAALRHPWLEQIDRTDFDYYKISSKYLQNYYRLFREWYDNASCKMWFRRRTLESAFTHPSRMVYPPGEYDSPRPTPSPGKTPRIPSSWEDQLPARSPLNYEIGLIKSESHYQSGPDTYLLQLRDVDFPVRLREYMKVAGSRGPGAHLIMSRENGFDWETPTVRERRRFTDIMDEEIDDERKTRINKYGANDSSSHTIRRLRHELGSRLDTYVEAEAYIESKQDGRLPFFREKPQTIAMIEGKDAEVTCFAVGEPQPVVQWFKNDGIVAESHRVKIETDDSGRSHMKLLPALSFDQGTYKVVARNKIGQTFARARIVYGSVPDEPEAPEASQMSDTEIFLTWKQPKFDGNSPVLCYSLEYKLADDIEWIKKGDNIDHEFYFLTGLIPNSAYMFRLAARNSIGWSEFGSPSALIRTKAEGAPKIHLSPALLHLQQITDSGQPVEVETQTYPNYETETTPVEWNSGNAQENYNFISEISRGQFSTVLKAIDKRNDALVIAKVIDLQGRKDDVDGEFAALRSLRHERIASLLEAYHSETNAVAVFVLEKLQGADILTYLASKHEYSEQTVATIVSQILDGLQYLHWRGLCHLDLQPDNIVMSAVRSVQIKLVDLGSAHRVTKMGTKVPIVGHLDYISPEVLNEEPAFPQTDIWTVGVLTYVMLSGVPPFKGQDENETKQNISFVRYRFEHLYKEISQESTRFLMLLFKRHPNKRPSAEECHENRWLLPTDHMIKKRERAVFTADRLKEYSTQYHNEKAQKAQDITSKLGGKFSRSHSVQEELLTAP